MSGTAAGTFVLNFNLIKLSILIMVRFKCGYELIGLTKNIS